MIANGKMVISMVVAALVAVAVTTLAYSPARAQKEGGAAVSPRYSVMDTEGHNLIVTDNQTNTVYFYTADKGADVGSDLKLRGSIDLTQVGKPVLKPTNAKE